ncbi:MAG TPA: helix-turn-helix domain-containing protein [Ilumatobacteraceae bacterium]|nr:helix-turn-helix domain-containing protein [Ilumatobacteraceae bacterium]HRB03095.1 helix-turn-helix domain-containing protein [Ilumatobacteraceae bacterium]
MNTPTDNMLSLVPINEAANRLGGISREKLYGLIRAGELATCHIGRRRFIASDELDRFIRAAQVAA